MRPIGIKTSNESTYLNNHLITDLVKEYGTPLYIIDGVPYDVTEVDSFLAIEDVAEITVDRDGSGYGSRGANGVVIIRTMRGSD